MSNSLITSLLSDSNVLYEESESPKKDIGFKLQFEQPKHICLSTSLNNVKELFEELFLYPSQKCTDSFVIQKVIALPSPIMTLVLNSSIIYYHLYLMFMVQ